MNAMRQTRDEEWHDFSVNVCRENDSCLLPLAPCADSRGYALALCSFLLFSVGRLDDCVRWMTERMNEAKV